MLGLWLQDGALTLRGDLPSPEPGPEEALIRVRQAGICNTDLELVRGYYPFAGVLGHEFVGTVERAPAGYEHLEGRRVVGEINAVCGDCGACRAGRGNHCERRTVLGIVDRDGAFAEYLALPVGNLHVVPDTVPDEAAVFTEPLAAALQIGRQVRIGPDDRVLVIGDGKLGQLVARTLHRTGARVDVAGRHREKLALLAARGLDTARVDDADDAINGEVESSLRGYDVVVDCAGSPAGFALARTAVRPRGTIVMKSTYADRLTLDASALVVDEITLVGSRCGPFGAALEVLEAGDIGVEELIVDSYPLTAGLQAFEKARTPGTLKVLLRTEA